MVLDDTQIDSGAGAASCGSFHPVPLQFEGKFLLIHRRWGQQRSLHPVTEPRRDLPLSPRDRLEVLGAAGLALCLPVAYGDDQTQLLPLAHRKGLRHLFIGSRHPAGVHPQILGLQHQMLAVIAALLLKPLSLRTHKGNVVGNAAEKAVVGQKAAESLALVDHKLNVQTAIQSTTTAIDSSKVKASNMALNVNTATAQDTTVTLNITTPADSNVAPPSQLINTQNENTVIFSMDIDGAVDASPEEGKQLKIPVQITLPVPAGINPAFLVILHEKSEGDWEELTLPHVYEEDGQWYATFNVHSFSHYAMGEKALTAQAEGTTVTLQAHLPTKGVQTQYLCAVYSAQGQMLGMGVLQPQSDDQLVITLAQDVPAGATMKIFAPDAGSGWAVHSEPAPVTIVSK